MKTNLLDYISVLLVFLFSFFVSEKAYGQTTIPVSVSMDTVLRKEYTGIINTMQFSVVALHQGLYTVVITEANGRQMFKKLVIGK